MKLNIAHLILTALLCVLVALTSYENYRAQAETRKAQSLLIQHAILQSEIQLMHGPCEEKPSPEVLTY